VPTFIRCIFKGRGQLADTTVRPTFVWKRHKLPSSYKLLIKTQASLLKGAIVYKQSDI